MQSTYTSVHTDANGVTRLCPPPEHQVQLGDYLCVPNGGWVRAGNTGITIGEFQSVTPDIIVGGPTTGDRVLRLVPTLATGRWDWATLEYVKPADDLVFLRMFAGGLGRAEVAACACEVIPYLKHVSEKVRIKLLDALKDGSWLRP